MTNKDLIIQLIQQDLKHNQLTGGLQKAGLETDLHNLEIIEVVARLMDVPKGEVSNQWEETYISFLEQAVEYKISDRAEELLPLAEECYNLLVACQNIESRISEQ
ncbi:hypothetical protein JYU20_03155 [Bacteroidales bacterium AH-315-I05]|nr:hypothetical protein [Bacteroidales bacterium AH-315-I05]